MNSATTVTEPARHRPVWQTVTLIGSRYETAAARTLVFAAPTWRGHVAGQHIDVKLTAPNGYSAQRSYSIASANEAGRLELTVQRVSEGEVSPYLVDEMEVGDELEVRGPIGGWFAWQPRGREAVLLVAGGSGVVPLMAMLREHARLRSETAFHLVYSVRSPQDVFYHHELQARAAAADPVVTTYVYTRFSAADATRPVGRLRLEDLDSRSWSDGQPVRSYVCGPTGFVDAAASLLQHAGHSPDTIRTERFGPTGGT